MVCVYVHVYVCLVCWRQTHPEKHPALTHTTNTTNTTIKKAQRATSHASSRRRKRDSSSCRGQGSDREKRSTAQHITCIIQHFFDPSLTHTHTHAVAQHRFHAHPHTPTYILQHNIAFTPSGYMHDVLQDAQRFADHRNSQTISKDDVKLAIASRAEFTGSAPPSREVREGKKSKRGGDVKWVDCIEFCACWSCGLCMFWFISHIKGFMFCVVDFIFFTLASFHVIVSSTTPSRAQSRHPRRHATTTHFT